MVTSEQSAQWLKQRSQARREKARKRGAALRALLPEAAACLRRYGASEVFLFGSLAHHKETSDSDVDLAVDQLKVGTYFDALADVTHILGAPVDLVHIPKASPSLRERIKLEGLPL